MYPVHYFCVNIGVVLVLLIHSMKANYGIYAYLSGELPLPEGRFSPTILGRFSGSQVTKLVIDVIASILHTTFWLIPIRVHLRSKDLNYLEHDRYYRVVNGMWHMACIPCLCIALFHSVYFFGVLVEQTGFLKIELLNILYTLFSTNIIGKHFENTTFAYVESIQRKFHCCGGSYYTDWLNFEVPALPENAFDPWSRSRVVGYFPPSCCDRLQSVLCDTKLMRPGPELGKVDVINMAPVQSTSCSERIYTVMYNDMIAMITVYGIVDILLHLLQFILYVYVHRKALPDKFCERWQFLPPPLQSLLTPLPEGSEDDSEGNILHETGSIEYLDGSCMHQDGEFTMADGTTIPRPELLMHKSGSVTHLSGSRTHLGGSRTHIDGSRTHRSGSVTYRDGSHLHSDGVVRAGPGDSRDVCVGFLRTSFFFGPTGYISNGKLLDVCQGTNLHARLSQSQLAKLKYRIRYIQKKKKIGWIIESGGFLQHTTTVPRIPIRTEAFHGAHEISKVKRILRKNLPFLEALLYADGNPACDLQANHIYRSYYVYIARGVIFILYGALAAFLLLTLFLQSTNLNSHLLNTARLESTDKVEIFSADLSVSENAWIVDGHVRDLTATVVYTTVILGTLLSRRVRCLLALLIPSLALIWGLIFLANLMIHAALIGPLATGEQNIIQMFVTLNRMAELAHNTSRDVRQYHKWLSDPRHAFEMTGKEGENMTIRPDSIYHTVQSGLGNITSALQKYKASVVSNQTLTEHLKEILLKIENDMKRTATAQQYANQVKISLGNWKKVLSRQFTKYKTEIAKDLDTLLAPTEFTTSVMNSLKQAHNWEALSDEFTITSCMWFHQVNMSSCLRMAETVCEVVKEAFAEIQLHADWMSISCPESGDYSVACPATSFIQMAEQDCSSPSRDAGFTIGTGMVFFEAKATLQTLIEQLKVQIYADVKPVVPTNEDAGIIDADNATSPETMTNSSYYQAERGAMIFQWLVIVSSLFKLSLIAVMFQAHCYISRYLLKDKYDNVYASQAFEGIEVKRRQQHQENVLPLKEHERKEVFWRHRCCTCAQFWSILGYFTMAAILGSALLLVFVVDFYLYELVAMLYYVTRGLKRHVDNPRAVRPYLTVSGDGLFYTVLQQLFAYFNQYEHVDFSYDFTPFVFLTHVSHKWDFYRAWALLLLVILCSSFLLRLRHSIAAFFYPVRTNSRAVWLYNYLLQNRKTYMNACRNHIVHLVREDRLQTEAFRLSQANWLTHLLPSLSNLLGLNKVTCIICRDRLSPGPLVHVCPVDGTATCGQCFLMLPTRKPVCIVCLDRDPGSLFSLSQKAARMGQRLSTRLNDMDKDAIYKPYFECLTRM